MSERTEDAAAASLTELLATIDRWFEHKDRASVARIPTPKEIEAFRSSNLAGRTRWLLLRRTTADGRVPADALGRAWRTKLERFRGQRFLVGGAPSPECAWLSVGPRNINGRIKSLALHRANGLVLYVGTANGGVWKTIDGGESWRPTMFAEQSLAIGAVAIDPNQPVVVYAGTGEPVYLLSNGGLLPPGFPTLAWWYEGAGVYKSVDGGDNWAPTGAIDNTFVYRVAVDPFDSQHVLCAGYSTSGAGGLCRSTDGGATWTTVVNGVVTDVLFDPINIGRAYAGQYGVGVLKSSDGGQTWLPRQGSGANTLPPQGQIGRVSLTLALATPDVLYAKLEDDATGLLLGIYRTATAAEPSGGAGGWTKVADPPVGGKIWWDSFIAADPTDPGGLTVFAGGLDVARSGDGGATWVRLTDNQPGNTPPSVPPTHPDQHALVFDPADSNTFYVANDGGIFRGVYHPNWAASGGPPATWTKVSTGLVVSQFYDLSASPVSRSVIGGGTQDNGTVMSTGGQSWRHVLGGDGGYVGFHPSLVHRFYAQYFDPDPNVRRARIMRSDDGGTSITLKDTGISGQGIFPAHVFAIDPTSPATVFVGTDRLFRTQTGGDPPSLGANAWSAVGYSAGPVAGDRVTEITLASSSVVYAGTLQGKLYRSSNANAAAPIFADITPGVAGFPARWLSGITAHPADPNTVYVTFLGFASPLSAPSDHVWKGVFNPGPPAGWTWNLIASNLLNVPISALAIDPATAALYVATDIGVFRSTNDGASWEPFEVGLPNVPVVDLVLDPSRKLLRAATHGFGVFQIRLAPGCPEVDIYVRDNLVDTGEVVPSPSDVPDPTQPGAVVRHFQSADIKVDAPPFDVPVGLIDGVEFDNPTHRLMGSPLNYRIENVIGIGHDNPIRGQTNRVYVQVHNRGWRTADEVVVKLLYADAGAGLPPLPADFWPAFPADTFTQTHWKPIGTATILDLPANVPRVLRWDWVPAPSSSDHVCLLAMVHSPQDPLLPQAELNVDILTPNNKRVTHKNVHPVTVTGGSAWMSIWLNNAFSARRAFAIRVEDLAGGHQGLRLLLSRSDVELEQPLRRSITGFRAGRLDAAEIRRQVSAGRRSGVMSEYVAHLLAGFDEALVLEVPTGQTGGELRGLTMRPEGAMPAVLHLALRQRSAKKQSWRFQVLQLAGKEIVGGSEFTGTAPVRPG